MDINSRLKWKVIILTLCLIGILLLLLFSVQNGRDAKEERGQYEDVLKENEMASLQGVGTQQIDSSSETQMEDAENTNLMAESKENVLENPVQNKIEDTNQNIRVLIMTDEYSDYYHQEIHLKVLGGFQINGDGGEVLEDGQELTISTDSPYFLEDEMVLKPLEEGNRLCLLSVARTQGNPSYQGTLTIYRDEKGMHMVNELPVEEYLKGVVPSEMPADYAGEALKAQAVCARTYAVVQMQSDKLSSLHAHVDDSVSYQVYNNISEDERTSQAVEETRGEILCKNQEPIDAYYFSTSHGKTSTDEVWEASAPASYLKSVVCEYDQEEPWYQWEVSFSKEELLKRIQAKYSNVQQIDEISIVERGEGDAVLTVKIVSGEDSIVVSNEYTIRELFSPKGLPIIRKDGSEVEGGTLLPSAYFTLSENLKNGETTSYTFHGGGYGHGVGLSQNGAKHMAMQGSKYQDILQYFYADVEILQIAEAVTGI